MRHTVEGGRPRATDGTSTVQLEEASRDRRRDAHRIEAHVLELMRRSPARPMLEVNAGHQIRPVESVTVKD